MANRNAYPSNSTGIGEVFFDFSFACNTAANPLATTFRGCPEYIASVVHSATGVYTVTLKDTWRYVISKSTDLEDLNASDDGAYASCGAVQNEGSATTGISFNVYTRAASGTKTDYASPRRVSVTMCLKNSSVGS